MCAAKHALLLKICRPARIGLDLRRRRCIPQEMKKSLLSELAASMQELTPACMPQHMPC